MIGTRPIARQGTLQEFIKRLTQASKYDGIVAAFNQPIVSVVFISRPLVKDPMPAPFGGVGPLLGDQRGGGFRLN